MNLLFLVLVKIVPFICAMCNVYLYLIHTINCIFLRLCCFVVGLIMGVLRCKLVGMLLTEMTRMVWKRRHWQVNVLRQPWGRGKGLGPTFWREGINMRGGWIRRGARGQLRIQSSWALVCVVSPWLYRDHLFGVWSFLSDWLQWFWTDDGFKIWLDSFQRIVGVQVFNFFRCSSSWCFSFYNASFDFFCIHFPLSSLWCF